MKKGGGGQGKVSLGYMLYCFSLPEGETYKTDDMDLGIRNKDLLVKSLTETVVEKEKMEGK